MLRLKTLAFTALPLTLAVAPQTPVIAQARAPLAQVSAHLRAVNTMTATFAQTDRRGATVSGTLTLKRPGKARFQYQRGHPLLVVADGRHLFTIDYQVKQVMRYPIGGSPLAILLDPSRDISKIATVTRNDAQVVLVRARDPKRPEFGTITLSFAKVSSGPAGLLLQGWTTIDSQNNRSTIRLSNQRFNVAVPDTAFRWTDPRPANKRG